MVRFAVGCGWGAIGLATMVICGWSLKVALLTTVVPGFVPMVPWTAVAIVSLGSAVIAAAFGDDWVAAYRVQCGGALLAGALPTSAALVALFAGALAARPTQGWVADLDRRNRRGGDQTGKA